VTPRGVPAQEEVKHAKRINYISSHADIEDSTKEMDLYTGAFATNGSTGESGDADASLAELRDDAADREDNTTRRTRR
jgi:hypothetical protein